MKAQTWSLSAELGVFAITRMTGIFRIGQERDQGSLGKYFLDQLDSRAKKIRRHTAHTGNIAAGKHITLDQARFDEIAGAGNDNWNRARGFFGSNRHRGAADHNDIGFFFDQLARQLGQTIKFSIAETVLDSNILAFFITEFAQSLAQAFVTGLVQGFGSRYQHSNFPNLPRLLRFGGKI